MICPLTYESALELCRDVCNSHEKPTGACWTCHNFAQLLVRVDVASRKQERVDIARAINVRAREWQKKCANNPSARGHQADFLRARAFEEAALLTHAAVAK